MATTAAKLIAIAKGEVGYHEGFSDGHWNNREKYASQVPGLAWVSTGGYPWCAVFVAWCAMEASVADLFPRDANGIPTASTDFGAAWFKQRGQWSEYPAVGAQIFFGTNGDMYHTGIVRDFDADNVYTIEGNTNASGSAEGDGVYLKVHARRDPRVEGYGYPKYADGLVSADPNYHPPKPPRQPSAGAQVESAITDLDKARGKGKRRKVLDRVLEMLKGLRR